MEGDYLELNQFLYNFYSSLLRTIGFLTSGIRAVDLETNECDRREFWKELRQMVNKVSEDVKALYESHNAILEKVKALAESRKAMKEELLKLQEDPENLSEEELQRLEGTSEKLQILESTKHAFDFESNSEYVANQHHAKVDEVVVVDATRSQDDQLLEETLNGHKVLLLNCKTLPALVKVLPINVDR